MSFMKYIALFLFLVGTFTGCQKQQVVSVEETMLYDPQVQGRGWAEQTSFYEPVAIEHETLYLTGPFEISGGDGVYDQATGEDLKAALTTPAAFLGQIIALPVTLFIDPPFQPQYSRSDFTVAAPAYEPHYLQNP